MSTEMPETRDYDSVRVYVSALVGLVVAFLLVWWASGFAVFYETLFRVGPTVQGGGIGADWAAGNTIPWLDLLVGLTHAADVLMGLFILLMVFLHWASFRRLAGRMRPAGEGEEAVVADGGPGQGGDRE
ncbi:MAG: hypothetical protein ABEH78_08255 [Haloferacaceae archaeon]